MITKLRITFLFSMIAELLLSQPLQTVSFVDLNKYAGKWYEISSYPQRFQKGCTCTTAEYTVTDKGYVRVVNTCRKDSTDGKISTIEGKAFIEPNSGNAKLKVQFFWPIKADYWIIDLADDYSYAVVSHPNKKYLWILSRQPKIEAQVYLKIIEKLMSKGFDCTKLITTMQQ